MYIAIIHTVCSASGVDLLYNDNPGELNVSPGMMTIFVALQCFNLMAVLAFELRLYPVCTVCL